MLIFATEPYAYLQQALCREADLPPGRIETKHFPDGEWHHRVADDVADRHVALLGGTVDDVQTLAMYDLACALVSQRAASLTMIVPYLGYSTMDRAVHQGEVVKAKTRARLLSAIPHADGGNRIALVDLHTAGLPYYFEGDMRPVQLDTSPFVLDAARRLGADDFVLASADAGRAKRVQSMAREVGVPAAVALKQRGPSGDVTLQAVAADVADRPVVMYDDMVRSGDTLLAAAEAYRRAGARSVAAVVTHGVLPGGALSNLRGSGLIDRLTCTDTHPRAHALRDAADAPGFLEVRCIAPLLATFLRTTLQQPVSRPR